MPKWMVRSVKNLVIFAVTLCVVILVALMLFENGFVYHPSRYPIGDWQPEGLVFKDVWFESSDGTRLHGWYVPHESPTATILYCHGNAGNLTHRTEVLRRLHDQVGASVMIFDYHGYGRSEGRPSESAFYDSARAARDWLARREQISPDEIVMLGRSIGGGVAVHLAANDGAKALVLESTFSSLPDAAANTFRWFPIRTLMRNRYDSVATIRQFDGPVFQSHGTADTLLPLHLGQKLHDAVPGPKRFFKIEGRGHNEPQPDDYYHELRKFLESLD